MSYANQMLEDLSEDGAAELVQCIRLDLDEACRRCEAAGADFLAAMQ